jgi:hypothetical protein
MNIITDKMKIWLESLPEKPVKDIKYCVYINRIQKRIDEELENFLWLCIHHPELVIDEETEINDLSGKIVSHRRLRKLMLCVNKINPNMNVVLVLEKLRAEEEANRPQPPPELLGKLLNETNNVNADNQKQKI